MKYKYFIFMIKHDICPFFVVDLKRKLSLKLNLFNNKN